MGGPAAGGAAAVLFDCGDVLYRWEPEAFLDRLLGGREARRRFVEEVGLFDWHDTLDGGRPFAEAAAELAGRFPHHADTIRAWGPRFCDTIGGPVGGVHELVAQLDDRGVPLFVVTNFSADFWPAFRARERGFLDRFRDVLVSGEAKLRKPDPAIYALALDRFRLRPGEALFVDDRPANVESARAAGMHAHLFAGADDLRARLEAEGLL